MVQVKVYGIREKLVPAREILSDVIQECLAEALQLPPSKRAHRFFPMDKDNMLYPKGRTDAYTIIELTMIRGRTVESRKRLVRLLFDRIEEKAGIKSHDIEICIQESSACNWGFRGMHGDEISLSYKIDV